MAFLKTKPKTRPTRQRHETKGLDEAMDAVLAQIKAEFPKPSQEGVAVPIDAQSYLVYDKDHAEQREFVLEYYKVFKKALSALKTTPHFSTAKKRSK